MRGFEMRGKWPGYMRTSTQVVMSPWGRLLVQRGSRAGGAAAALWRQPKVCMCICTSRRGSRGNRGFSAFVPGVGHFSENAYRGTHMYTLILSKTVVGRRPRQSAPWFRQCGTSTEMTPVTALTMVVSFSPLQCYIYTPPPPRPTPPHAHPCPRSPPIPL